MAARKKKTFRLMYLTNVSLLSMLEVLDMYLQQNVSLLFVIIILNQK